MSVIENPQVLQLKEMYDSFQGVLNGIDEALDSTVDAKSAGKRAHRNRIVDSFKDDWEPVSNEMVANLRAFDLEKRVAFFSAFQKALTEAFEKEVDEYLIKLVEENKPAEGETPTFTEDQIKELQTQRSAMYKQMKTTRELALIFKADPEAFPLPRKRTGTHGKRGTRAINTYQWAINGEDLSDEKNKILWISKEYDYENAAAFRKALMDSLGLKDLKEPPADITFALPNGDVLTGHRDISEDTANGESEDDEDDEDDDEDENDD